MLTSLEIGKRIAQARKIKGFSQAQIANHLTVSPQAVGKWERGESLPDIILLDQMARFLGVGLDYFSEANPLLPAKIADVEETNEETQAISENQTESQSPNPAKQTTETSSNSDIPKWDFSHGDWRDSDFSGLHNLADKLKGSNIKNCQFVDSELRNLELNGSNIVNSSFNGSDLTEATFIGCNVVHDFFDSCLLTRTKFSGCSITDCSFQAADLSAMTIEACSFKRCILQDAVLTNTVFKYSQLSGVTLSGDISSCSFEDCELSGTEFRDAHLTNTFFKGKGLKKVRLINCTVDKITFAFLTSGKINMSNVTVVE